MGRVPQTERNISILRDHSKGMKPADLAEKYNVTPAVIYNVVKLTSDSYWEAQPEPVKNSIIRMHNDDYDSEYIADNLDISVPEVIGFLLYIHRTPNDPGWGDSSKPVKSKPVARLGSQETTSMTGQRNNDLLKTVVDQSRPIIDIVREQLSNAKPSVDIEFCAESTADILSEKSGISDEESLLDAVAEYISDHWNDTSATADVLILLHAYGCADALAVYTNHRTSNAASELGEAVRVGKAYVELLDTNGYKLK